MSSVGCKSKQCGETKLCPFNLAGLLFSSTSNCHYLIFIMPIMFIIRFVSCHASLVTLLLCSFTRHCWQHSFSVLWSEALLTAITDCGDKLGSNFSVGYIL
jgi:hypothetical protein